MKKLLGCFLCVMLLVFFMVPSLQATPFHPMDPTVIYDFPNSWQKDTPYIASDFWSTQGATYIGGSADLWYEGWTENQSAGQDNSDNVTAVIGYYNTDNPSIMVPPLFDDGYKIDVANGGKSGSLSVGGYEYITLKWDGVFGLWDVRGLETFDFSGLNWGLSHYTRWNHVPEPATMFLLGTGLIVLAGFGRKKFLKK